MCDQCGKIFARGRNLRDHIYSQHLPKEQKSLFECYLCRETFFTRIGVKYHMAIHVGKKMVQCTVCNVMTDRRSYSRHFKSHSNIKPFSCSQCDKTFTFLQGLKVNKRSNGLN